MNLVLVKHNKCLRNYEQAADMFFFFFSNRSVITHWADKKRNEDIPERIQPWKTGICRENRKAERKERQRRPGETMLESLA